MAKFNPKEKLLLNSIVSLCREYRFHEARKRIASEAGLPVAAADLPVSELRPVIDSRIKNGVAPAVAGEMLRIDSTFRYVRDIHHYTQKQVLAIIGNLDQTLPLLNPDNLWPVVKKMENIYHLSGEEPLYHKLKKDHKAIDKVRRLNKLLKDKKNPLPAPNYANVLKQSISNEGVNSLNQELAKPHSLSEKIRLNEEKIYLIENTSWCRSQKYLNKSQTYNQLYALYYQNGEPQKAQKALNSCTRFYSSYRHAMSFNPEYKQIQNREEWLYK